MMLDADPPAAAGRGWLAPLASGPKTIELNDPVSHSQPSDRTSPGPTVTVSRLLQARPRRCHTFTVCVPGGTWNFTVRPRRATPTLSSSMNTRYVEMIPTYRGRLRVTSMVAWVTIATSEPAGSCSTPGRITTWMVTPTPVASPL